MKKSIDRTTFTLESTMLYGAIAMELERAYADEILSRGFIWFVPVVDNSNYIEICLLETEDDERRTTLEITEVRNVDNDKNSAISRLEEFAAEFCIEVIYNFKD